MSLLRSHYFGKHFASRSSKFCPMRTALLFAIVLVVVASATAEDGCGLVTCPPSMPGVHNVIPNPHDTCSFCCCRTGTPEYKECPPHTGYEHGSRKCIKSSECSK
ncbi:hypothetical protein J437_LFUL009220 [Ladona fulva]|uniref:Uncharacterized protein n=1 Tax=Ladona fulva TaxID=123851 RepID=A0A8K0K6A8_LADFU|nr:hypothetical protein J437_LFUL009220 [Ladona fulva]